MGKLVGGGRSGRHSHWGLRIFLMKSGVKGIAKVDGTGDFRMRKSGLAARGDRREDRRLQSSVQGPAE